MRPAQEQGIFPEYSAFDTLTTKNKNSRVLLNAYWSCAVYSPLNQATNLTHADSEFGSSKQGSSK
jgi:hypothetical protein